MFRRSVVPARLRRRRMTNFGWESLCNAAQMDRILRREMARADRGGHRFSLVLFRARPGPQRHLSTHRLARALLRRARLTDVVGWFAEDYVCALLTDTPADGARVFADRISLDLGAHVPRPLGVVYTYQPHTLPNNGQALAKGQAPGDLEQSRCGLDRSSAPQHVPVDLSQFVQQGFTEEMDAPALSEKSVEELMYFPLPAWKRVIDIIGSILGMIVLFPLLLAAAIGILLTSPGPIIFRQRRTGLGGRPFVIYKFRTMVPGAEQKRNELATQSEQDGPAFKMENDPRLTRFGRFLRKSSIDELPQLYNVLK
ncbi:MAG TPA: sugar transferase, partial [Tepidisphaeraceae bacterium]|nr:sugar transferase [Tepidisphaeraceae bacterium]